MEDWIPFDIQDSNLMSFYEKPKAQKKSADQQVRFYIEKEKKAHE